MFRFIIENELFSERLAGPVVVRHPYEAMMSDFFKNIFRKRKLTYNSGSIILMPIDDDIWVNIQTSSWIEAGVKLNKAASNETITDTQNKLKYEFPNDFINFYKKHNGFVEWDFIGNMFSIWSMDKIADEYKSSDDKNFIPFCDHCIDLYRIGYLKSAEGVYKDFNHENPIAKTFGETVRLIIEDSQLLY